MKEELRDMLRQRMAACGADRIHRDSHRAAERLVELPEYQQAEIILTYLSLPLEADTDSVVLHAWQHDKRVLAPFVHWERRQIIPVEINSLDDDVFDEPQGVRQPAVGEPFPVELIDFVIVPGIGFDVVGHRLGRGKGFYDRFLAHPALRAVCCGFALEFQVVEAIPCEPLDVPVHMLVTDQKVRRFVHAQRMR